VFYRGGGGAEGTKTHEKLILLEADLANHGRVSRDLTDEEIPGDVDHRSERRRNNRTNIIRRHHLLRQPDRREN